MRRLAPFLVALVLAGCGGRAQPTDYRLSLAPAGAEPVTVSGQLVCAGVTTTVAKQPLPWTFTAAHGPLAGTLTADDPAGRFTAQFEHNEDGAPQRTLITGDEPVRAVEFRETSSEYARGFSLEPTR